MVADAGAEAAGVSDRTARKWLGRYRAEGAAGLLDRSSAPAVVANRTDERRVQAIAALRRLRMTGAEIAEVLDMALSTVSAILTRIGMGKLGRLGLEPVVRYERQRPGELIHIDVKKLGRIQGGAGKRVRDGLRRHDTPAAATPRARCTKRSAGSSCTSRSTTHPPGLRRSARRREGDHRHRLPRPRRGALRRPRHHRAAGHDRRMKVKWPGRLRAPLGE